MPSSDFLHRRELSGSSRPSEQGSSSLLLRARVPAFGKSLAASKTLASLREIAKKSPNGSSGRQPAKEGVQSTDALHRITAAKKTAARHDAAELKPAPLITGGERRRGARLKQKNMTLTTAALGSLSGLFIGVFSNGVRKLPLFRRPWDHLILMGLMGYGGHKYPQLEDATLERVNAMRAARKLGPLDKNVWGLAVSKQEASQNKD